MIDETSKQIAFYLKDAFSGEPKVQRYKAADNVRYVDIIKTPHPDGVSYVGTIGGYNRSMQGAPSQMKSIRVELVSAVQERYVEIMAETLSYLILCLDNNKTFYHPGMIVENAVPENNLSALRHIYLCDPFLWEDGLKSIQLDKCTLAFLYALPISDKEMELFQKEGEEAFENYLQQNEIPYYDMQRNN